MRTETKSDTGSEPEPGAGTAGHGHGKENNKGIAAAAAAAIPTYGAYGGDIVSGIGIWIGIVGVYLVGLWAVKLNLNLSRHEDGLGRTGTGTRTEENVDGDVYPWVMGMGWYATPRGWGVGVGVAGIAGPGIFGRWVSRRVEG